MAAVALQDTAEPASREQRTCFEETGVIGVERIFYGGRSSGILMVG
jgi:hypothetical protein